MIESVEKVLIQIRDTGLKLKPDKCVVFQTQVHYLGHVVYDKGISTDPAKIQRVKEWPIL